MIKQSFQDYDALLKIVLIGPHSVGKSSILFRYTDDTFPYNIPLTIGIDFKYKYIEEYNKKIKLQVWDSSGSQRFLRLQQNYYRGMVGVLLIYDITNRKSYEDLNIWIHYFLTQEKQDFKKIFAIIGNKSDLEHQREVAKDEAKQLADSYGFLFFEVSAKTSQNLNETFGEFMNNVLLRK